MMEMIKAEVAVDDTRQKSLSPTPPNSGVLSLFGQTPPNVEFRHLFGLDSGVGSATSSESETSDCDKARRLASQSAVDAAKESEGSAVATLGWPDWTRIKQFYGIPKPVFELPPRPARPTKRQHVQHAQNQHTAVVKFSPDDLSPKPPAAILSADQQQQLQGTKNRSDTVP